MPSLIAELPEIDDDPEILLDRLECLDLEYPPGSDDRAAIQAEWRRMYFAFVRARLIGAYPWPEGGRP